MSKVIYSGLEGEGKSLRLAMKAEELVERNARWYQTSGIQRPIASNLRFSPEFFEGAAARGVPILYWDHLHELIRMEQVDVLMDEVGNYFDSRLWKDLSLDARRWLTQGDKRGIELYGTAQDFAQVDKSFRRLVKELYYIKKAMGSPRPSATKPPVSKIWGFCWIFSLDPMGYDEENDKFTGHSIFDWRFFIIKERHCKMFDTTQLITRSNPPPLRHEELRCEFFGEAGHDCRYHLVRHV